MDAGRSTAKSAAVAASWTRIWGSERASRAWAEAASGASEADSRSAASADMAADTAAAPSAEVPPASLGGPTP